jgi:uncharacterized protein YggE
MNASERTARRVGGVTSRPGPSLGGVLAVAALAVALVVATACTKVVTTDTATTNSVTAAGQGKASATPDEAVMTFGVTSNAPDPKTALASASKTAAKITGAIKGQGIPAEDIQTWSIELYPRASKTKPGRNYQASISVRVTIRDIDKVGDVVGAADGAGATNINGPNFTVSDWSPYQTKAIDRAVKDARSNAEAMAKAAGRTLGNVISVSTASANVPVAQYGSSFIPYSGMRGLTVPVEPGQMEITEDVTVVFDLK